MVAFNDLEAIRNAKLTINDLKEMKEDADFYVNKNIIDDYKVQSVENKMFENAESGDFNSAKFILMNKSEDYKTGRRNRAKPDIENILKGISHDKK